MPGSFSWSDDRKEIYRSHLLTEEARQSISDLMVELEKEVQIDLLKAKFSNIILDAATSSLKFRLFKPKKKRRRKQIWFDNNCLFLQRELRS